MANPEGLNPADWTRYQSAINHYFSLSQEDIAAIPLTDSQREVLGLDPGQNLGGVQLRQARKVVDGKSIGDNHDDAREALLVGIFCAHSGQFTADATEITKLDRIARGLVRQAKADAPRPRADEDASRRESSIFVTDMQAAFHRGELPQSTAPIEADVKVEWNFPPGRLQLPQSAKSAIDRALNALTSSQLEARAIRTLALQRLIPGEPISINRIYDNNKETLANLLTVVWIYRRFLTPELLDNFKKATQDWRLELSPEQQRQRVRAASYPMTPEDSETLRAAYDAVHGQRHQLVKIPGFSSRLIEAERQLSAWREFIKLNAISRITEPRKVMIAFFFEFLPAGSTRDALQGLVDRMNVDPKKTREVKLTGVKIPKDNSDAVKVSTPETVVPHAEAIKPETLPAAAVTPTPPRPTEPEVSPTKIAKIGLAGFDDSDWRLYETAIKSFTDKGIEALADIFISPEQRSRLGLSADQSLGLKDFKSAQHFVEKKGMGEDIVPTRDALILLIICSASGRYRALRGSGDSLQKLTVWVGAPTAPSPKSNPEGVILRAESGNEIVWDFGDGVLELPASARMTIEKAINALPYEQLSETTKRRLGPHQEAKARDAKKLIGFVVFSVPKVYRKSKDVLRLFLDVTWQYRHLLPPDLRVQFEGATSSFRVELTPELSRQRVRAPNFPMSREDMHLLRAALQEVQALLHGQEDKRRELVAHEVSLNAWFRSFVEGQVSMLKRERRDLLAFLFEHLRENSPRRANLQALVDRINEKLKKEVKVATAVEIPQDKPEPAADYDSPGLSGSVQEVEAKAPAEGIAPKTAEDLRNAWARWKQDSRPQNAKLFQSLLATLMELDGHIAYRDDPFGKPASFIINTYFSHEGVVSGEARKALIKDIGAVAEQANRKKAAKAAAARSGSVERGRE